MLYLAIGLTTLVGYIVFDQKFPRRPIVKAEVFKLDKPIVYGDNYLRSPTKIGEVEDTTEYQIDCRITPCKALLRDGCYYDMKVPDEYTIKSFVIGVDSQTNELKWVDLGPEQYHADKNPKTDGYPIGNLHGEELERELLAELFARLMVYRIENPKSFKHMENEAFLKMNSSLFEEMRKV